MACLYSVGIWIFLIQLLANGSEASRHNSLRRRRASNRSGGTIVFKDSEPFRPTISPECERTSICENVPGYPESRVENIVHQLLRNYTKFNEDMLDNVEIAQRFGEDEQTLSLCRSREKLMQPQAAKDITDQWYFVINKVLGVNQSYRVEICESGHTQCNKVATFALGNKPRCKQKYILRSMVALDYEGRPIERHFKVPSCCSCVYETTI